jgi:hypothetical protein
MKRTPEQEAADEQLRAAIDQVTRAYDLIDDGSIIADYVVVGAAQRLDEEHGDETQMFYAMPGGTMPHYRVIGLLRAELAYLERDVSEGDC